LVQLNVSLLVAQLKFKPSKHEIRLLSNKFFFIYSAVAVVYAVSYYPAASIKLPNRKKILNNFIADLRNIINLFIKNNIKIFVET